MKLYNLSYVSDDTIRGWLQRWGIDLDPEPVIVPTFTNDRGYPSPEGDDVLLVCDPRDLSMCGTAYGGLTYPGGSTAVYFYPEDAEVLCVNMDELARLYELRLVHEMLHHMNLPSDDMENWINDQPFWTKLRLKILLMLGFHNPSNLFVMSVQAEFYRYLLWSKQ